MRGVQWWVAAGLLLMPLAAAGEPQVMEITAKMAALEIDGGSNFKMREGLFRLDLGPDERPSLSLDAATIVVTQYWSNATTFVDPLTGKTLERYVYPAKSRTLALQPERVTFLQKTDRPDVRLALSSVTGVTVEEARFLRMDATAKTDLLGPSRAFEETAQLALAAFDRPIAHSGWAEMRASGVSGPGDARILIDGWDVVLEEPTGSLAVRTGTSHSQVHTVAEGGHHEESYTFLLIRAADIRLGLADKARLEGYAPAAHLDWTGPARLELLRADVDVGTTNVPVAEKELSLDGRYQADVEFGADSSFAGASFTAVGMGVTSIPLPGGASGGLGILEKLGVWTSVGVGALTVGILGIQTYRAPKRAAPAIAGPPAPAPPAPPEKLGLGDLIERAQKTPLDGEVQFHLGVELYRVGRADVGLRAIDRSFRLHPPAIVKLLEDPELAPIRDRDEIRELLVRFQREQHRKVWAGYA